MIITVIGSYSLPSDIQRLLFGVTSYLLPRHSVRIALSKGEADEATLAAVERHILESNEFDIEAYKTSSEAGSFVVGDFIVGEVIDWTKGDAKELLRDYASSTLINYYKLGQMVCAIRGQELDHPSDIVVYAGDTRNDDVEYRVARNAARDASAEFINLGDEQDIARLFKVTSRGLSYALDK